MRPAYLEPNEQVLNTSRPHPTALLFPLAKDTVVLLLVIAAAVGAWFLGAPDGIVVGIATPAVALWILVALVRWRRHATTRYTVTTLRVYRAAGRVFFRLHFTTHEKITDLQLRQGPLGRQLGYGTLLVSTAGGDIGFTAARDPMRLRSVVENARGRMLSRLVGRAPQRTATQPRVQTQTQEEGARHRPTRGPVQVVWSGGPCGFHLAGRLIGGVPLLAFSGFLIVIPLAILLESPGAFWFVTSLIILGFLALWVAMAVGAHRRARYEVTTRGVRVTTGLFTRRYAETTFDKITDVSSHKSLSGNLFGFGNISINTAGGQGAPIHFQGVAQPERVKATIQRTREEAS